MRGIPPLLRRSPSANSLSPKRNPPSRRRFRRSPLILFLLLLLWSLVLGWGLAQAVTPPTPGSSNTSIGTVDVVPDRYRLGQELYLENCATCHVAIPPAVFPQETWRETLLYPEHYGVTIPLIPEPGLQAVWFYLRDFSRPQPQGDQTPFRFHESRFFKALHPRVDLPRPVPISSCVECHPGASAYDYRTLAPEWENAP